MAKTLSTRFTKLFSCRVPIMGAPMAGVSGGELASATCFGGGLGFIAAGHLIDESQLRNQIDIFRQCSPNHSPLCLGFIVHSSMKYNSSRVAAVLKEHRPNVVQFAMPAIFQNGENVKLAQSYGAKVIVQVGSELEAREALQYNIDGIIAQGREAGGHGLRSELGTSTIALTSRILSLVQEQSKLTNRYQLSEEGSEGDQGLQLSSKPIVLAAGGIVNGKGLASMLALGCDGVVFGTRLWASKEALGSSTFKEALVRASCDDVIRTEVFDQIGNAYQSIQWPYPYDSVGALNNKTCQQWHFKIQELKDILAKTAVKNDNDDNKIVQNYRRAIEQGNDEIGGVWSGEGVGDIDSVESASKLIQRAEQDAYQQLQSMRSVCR